MSNSLVKFWSAALKKLASTFSPTYVLLRSHDETLKNLKKNMEVKRKGREEALSEYGVSHAQYFEDVILYKFLHPVENGFYVDVGCSDPDISSVTKFFYERGWSGINIDPRKEEMRKYEQLRKRDVNYCFAVSNEAGERMFWVYGGVSTFDRETVERLRKESGFRYVETRVETRLLNDVLACHGEGRDIHFLKIDVERHEREVLEGLDLHRFRPWMIVVESTLPNTFIDCFAEWENDLLANGYSLAVSYEINRYYVSNEKREELQANFLRLPVFPCVTAKHRRALWERG